MRYLIKTLLISTGFPLRLLSRGRPCPWGITARPAPLGPFPLGAQGCVQSGEQSAPAPLQPWPLEACT